MKQELFTTMDIANALEYKTKNPRRDVAKIAEHLGLEPVETRRPIRNGKPAGGQPEKLWSREQRDAILADNHDRHTKTAQILSSDATPNDTPVVAEPAPVVEVVITLADRANRIRQLQADVQRGIIQIGEELIAAKQEVGHGNWSQWLDKEFAWSDRTARRFMAVAERFGKMDNVVRFQPSTLQAMLALPEGDEQEFIAAHSDQGTPVEKQSAREVQRNVKEWKQHKANPAPAEETDDRPVVSENVPAADPLPAQIDKPTAKDTYVVITPAQVTATRKLIEETSDIHTLKTIHDSLLALAQEIGKVVLLAEMKIGELAQKN